MRLIVKLDDESVVSYPGAIEGFAATSPSAARTDRASGAVLAYRGYLAHEQSAFEAAAVAAISGARVTYRYQMVFGGVAMQVPEDQIGRVARLPGVRKLYRNERRRLLTDTSPKFIGAKVLWSELGGQASAGERVVVGMLDTGIWPEHPSSESDEPNDTDCKGPITIDRGSRRPSRSPR